MALAKNSPLYYAEMFYRKSALANEQSRQLENFEQDWIICSATSAEPPTATNTSLIGHSNSDAPTESCYPHF